MLELVLVLVLLAGLSIVLVPRLLTLGAVSVNQQAEQLRRDVVRVQLLAISQAQRLRLTVTAVGYSVASCTTSSSCVTAVPDPQTGAAFVASLSSGASFTTTGVLDFDSLGRPAQTSALISSITRFTLAGNGQSVNVEVLPLTGYARVVN